MAYADIAVNLTDPMFQGTYHGRAKHPSDLDAVVARARTAGVDKILITGTSLKESSGALSLARRYGQLSLTHYTCEADMADLCSTAGVHPTSTNELDSFPRGAEAYLSDLNRLIEEDRGEGGSKRITSIGEVGLDYDRLNHSPADTQLKHLPALLRLSQEHKLPLFLHSRAPQAHRDLVRILREVGWGERGEGWYGGVVHSFTGTREEMIELVEMGLYIGVNGCSLKTPKNLDVVNAIPLSSLMLETDAPWCSISSSHAAHVHLPTMTVVDKVAKPEKWKAGLGIKGRNEPAEVVTIAHVVASVKAVPVEKVARATWENSLRLFWPSELDAQSNARRDDQ